MLDFLGGVDVHEVLAFALALVGAAAIAARWTPTQVDNQVADFLLGWLNRFAGNGKQRVGTQPGNWPKQGGG